MARGDVGDLQISLWDSNGDGTTREKRVPMLNLSEATILLTLKKSAGSEAWQLNTEHAAISGP